MEANLQVQAHCPIRIVVELSKEDSDTEEEDYCKLKNQPVDLAPERDSHFFKHFKSNYSVLMDLSAGDVES